MHEDDAPLYDIQLCNNARPGASNQAWTTHLLKYHITHHWIYLQAKAGAQVKDLMNRLNNAVKQRNAAREEALLASEKLKKLEEDLVAGRLQMATAPAASPVGTPLADGSSTPDEPGDRPPPPNQPQPIMWAP